MNVPGGSIVTSKALVNEMDLCKISAEDAKAFTSEFELRQLEGGDKAGRKMQALVIWFDTLFSKNCCPEEVTLTTSPEHEKTHWAQTLLVLPEPVDLGERTLKCRLAFEQHSDDYRGLHLVLEYGFQKSSKDGSYPHAAQYELV